MRHWYCSFRHVWILGTCGVNWHTEVGVFGFFRNFLADSQFHLYCKEISVPLAYLSNDHNLDWMDLDQCTSCRFSHLVFYALPQYHHVRPKVMKILCHIQFGIVPNIYLDLKFKPD